jgi:hypothetical protein
VHSSSTPRQSGFPKNVLVLSSNFPLGTGSSTAATHDGLKVQPEGLALLIDDIDDI